MKLILLFFMSMLMGCADKDLLSPEEMLFLKQHGPITVAAKYHPPYIFVNEKGEAAGVARDYMDLITKRSGVQFKVTKTGQLDIMLEAMSKGEVDMVASVRETPERKLYANFTRPFVVTPLRLFYKNELKTEPKPRVASVRPFAVTQHLELAGYPVYPTFDDDEGLNLLEAGKVDAVAIDVGTANFLFKQRPGMKSLNSVEYPYEYPLAFAYTKKLPELNGILVKLQNLVSDEETEQIAQKWSTTKIEK